ncbi:MAG: hypothetical protein U0231_21440, partial [Nitrospiraceae bacterium]
GRLRRADLHDPYTIRYWPWKTGRDPARTPMPWDDSPQAGFTTGRPWLPLSQAWRQTNVAGEQRDPGSILSLYKRLIRMKKGSNALTVGTYHAVDGGPPECLLFRRDSHLEGQRDSLFIAINFSAQTQKISLQTVHSELGRTGTLILSTDTQRAEGPWTADHFLLGPDEGIVVSVA